MQDVDTGRFTVGVFQDTTWAERGINALKTAGFPGGVAHDSCQRLAGHCRVDRADARWSRSPDRAARSWCHSGARPSAGGARKPGFAKVRPRCRDASGGLSATRRAYFRNAGWPWRRACRHPQRTCCSRRAGIAAFVRRRECGDWSLERTGLIGVRDLEVLERTGLIGVRDLEVTGADGSDWRPRLRSTWSGRV